jgi:hypothetical protein
MVTSSLSVVFGAPSHASYSRAGRTVKSIPYDFRRGGGTQLKISRNVRGRLKIAACIAGVLVTLPNRSAKCGLMKFVVAAQHIERV